MRFGHALELKNECFAQNYNVPTQDVGLRVNSLPAEAARGSQFSIGFSRRGSDNYHLEVRTDRESGRSYDLAQEFKKRAPDEIHIGVVENLVVPAPEALAQAARETQASSWYRDRMRPLHLGLSVGNLNGGVGTIGGFVEDAQGQPAIISNCHVLASLRPRDELDRRVYQPGRQDVPLESLLGSHAIATLGDHTTFSASGANYLDAAYAILDRDYLDQLLHPNGNVVPDRCPHAGTRIREVANYEKLGPNQKVAKVGRTTGWTVGTVGAFGVDDRIINIPYHGNRRFDDLLEIQWDSPDAPFTAPGDSGSLIFMLDRFAAVGLHFASGVLRIDGNRVHVSYACSLARVLQIFNLTWM